MSEFHWVFGIHAVEALLKRQPDSIEALYFQQGRKDERMETLHQLAATAGIASRYMSRDELDEMVRDRHQGVVARTHRDVETLGHASGAAFA